MDAPDFSDAGAEARTVSGVHLEQHRRAAAVARVALSGDGGDDVLLAHAWPYLLLFAEARKYYWAMAAGSRPCVELQGRLAGSRMGIRSGIQNRFRKKSETKKFPEWINQIFEKRLNCARAI